MPNLPLNLIKIPFGKAIIEEPIKIQNAQNAINALKDELEQKLLPLFQTKIQN